MVVICKKGTIKLVKGLSYEVIELDNSKSETGKVLIKDIGWYTVNNFETLEGNPLPKINISRKEPLENRLEFYELSKGDILICETDSYKTLIKKGLYKIEELSSINKQRKHWNGTFYTNTENYIKFEGVSRKLMFSCWRFSKMPTNEAREMTLELVLNDVPDKVTRKDFRNLRKIEHIENKNNELMLVLARSILDKNRHQLSIIDWAVEQLGKKMDINIDDYNMLINMKLKDVLELIENK